MKFWRKHLDMSQREMSEMLGISQGRLQEYEKKAEMKYDDLVQLCNHNNLKITMFLTVEMTQNNYTNFFISEGAYFAAGDVLSEGDVVEVREVEDIVGELVGYIPEENTKERFLLKELLASHREVSAKYDDLVSVARIMANKIPQ